MRRIARTLLGILLMQTGFSAAGNLSDIPGVRGGLVVVVGCDGEFPVTGFESRSVFQYLDSNPANVESMRARIRARGDYGRASAVVFDGRSLPYIDNSVNLLVIRSSAAQVSNEEMTRVLSPRGVLAVTRNAEIPNLPVEAYGRWNIYRKPVPDSIDSWPQFLYDASNNAISRDTTVGPPVSMQWRAGPPFTRHHHADKGTRPTIRAVIAASGRLYYMIDETNSSNLKTPSAWFLLARDAFNGIELWKVPVKSAEFAAKLENVRRSLVADEVDGGRVYATMSTPGPLSQIDGASGKTIRTYSGSENAVEVINDGQDVFVVNGEGSILGYRSESSEQRWRWNPGKDDAIYPLTTAAAGGRVFVKTDTSAVCLAADSGKILWQTALQAAQVRKRFKNPHERLLVADGVVLCSYAGTDGRLLYKDNREFTGLHPQVRPYDGKLAALSAETGEILWSGPYYPSLDDGSPGEIYVRNGRVGQVEAADGFQYSWPLTGDSNHHQSRDRIA